MSDQEVLQEARRRGLYWDRYLRCWRHRNPEEGLHRWMRIEEAPKEGESEEPLTSGARGRFWGG